MSPILLHGTVDRHDALAVVVVALTLALGSALGSLRRRQATGQRPAASPDDAGCSGSDTPVSGSAPAGQDDLALEEAGDAPQRERGEAGEDDDRREDERGT